MRWIERLEDIEILIGLVQPIIRFFFHFTLSPSFILEKRVTKDYMMGPFSCPNT